MAYYLGIDGGGSKTTCAVGDESSVLAMVTTGPSNITRVGEVRARESIHAAIRETCDAAGITPRQIERVCIGIAGAGRTEVRETIRAIAAEIVTGEIEVVGDMQIALAAAFGAGPGVIVIAGTGSIAYGRDAQGKTARAGGWGFAISDEGSAHWIGRAAVANILRAIDERTGHEIGKEEAVDAPVAAPALPLLLALSAKWNLQTLDQFVCTANSNPDFAALLPPIVAAADGGDAIGQRVLQQAGEELAQLAGVVVRRLFAQNGAGPIHIPLAVAGGVFRNCLRVRDVFRNQVRQLDSRLQVNSQVIDPVTGALLMARQGRRPD